MFLNSMLKVKQFRVTDVPGFFITLPLLFNKTLMGIHHTHKGFSYNSFRDLKLEYEMKI